MHLKPTAGRQISTLIFEKKIQSKVFPGPLTDLSAWVGFLIFEKKIMEGGLYKYSMKNILRTAFILLDKTMSKLSTGLKH